MNMTKKQFDGLIIFAHSITLLIIMIQAFFILPFDEWVLRIVLMPTLEVIMVTLILDLETRVKRKKIALKKVNRATDKDFYSVFTVWVYLILPLFSFVIIFITAQITHSYSTVFYLILANAFAMGNAIYSIKNYNKT